MRNIQEYQENYIISPFEEIQVKYRRKKVQDFLLQYAKKNATILEIGCGLEPLFLDENNEYSFVIVEPGKMFYENAIEKSKDRKVVCYEGFFENQIENLRKHHYDIVILSSLLHEVENSTKMLEILKGICSQDTYIHINVPNAKSFHRILAAEMNVINSIYAKSDRQIKLEQRTVYDLNGLVKETQEMGFTVVEKGSYFVKPFTHAQMQRGIEMEIIDEKILDGLYNMVKYMPEYGSEIYVNLKLT